MSPRLRTHLVTAGLFAAIVLVVLLVWWLRGVLVYVFLAGVGLLAYWGLYLLVSSRLRGRPADAEEAADEYDGERDRE